MRAIAVIENQEVIKRIFNHLGLRHVEPRPVCVHRTGRPPPRIPKAQPRYFEPYVDYSDSQVPSSDNRLYLDLSSCDAQANPVSPVDLPV